MIMKRFAGSAVPTHKAAIDVRRSPTLFNFAARADVIARLRA
jgi:hypothetical protein